ncbi:unnamed protein product, partial [marine sediment metagenome]
WFISPSMPTSFIYKTVQIGEKGGNQFWSVNKLFVEYFKKNSYKNLKNLIERWKKNPIFKKRMKIFRDCLSILKNVKNSINPSNLVLPTLIAQIDGIQTEFMIKNGLYYDIGRRGWKNRMGRIIQKKSWFLNQTLNSELLDQANDLCLNILFQESFPGTPLNNSFVTFSRHKILHGEYLRYGRIDNTIRAFLILDFLVELTN